MPVLRHIGSREFVAVLELDEGIENPLPSVEAARRLHATVAGRAIGAAPTLQPLVLGSYRMFD
jgi:hypothetical protein